MAELLEQAVERIITGDKSGGARLLADVLRNNPASLDAWLWMAEAVAEPERKRFCLEQALKLEPGHPEATFKLAQLSGPAEAAPLPSLRSPRPRPPGPLDPGAEQAERRAVETLVKAPAPLEEPALEVEGRLGEQPAFWFNPQSTNARLLILSRDGWLIANPDPKAFAEVRRLLETGQIPMKIFNPAPRLIAMKTIEQVLAKRGATAITLTVGEGDEAEITELEFANRKTRNQALRALIQHVEPDFERRHPEFVRDVMGPLLVLVVLTSLTSWGVLGINQLAANPPTGMRTLATLAGWMGTTGVIAVGAFFIFLTLLWLALNLLRSVGTTLLIRCEEEPHQRG